MMVAHTVLDDLAILLSYPGEDVAPALTRTLRYVSSTQHTDQRAETHCFMEKFAEGIGVLSLTESEELYTRTFDINPTSSLELGWHLYGEQYERGAFLVLMRGKLREHGVEEGSELPDHLTHVLRVLGRMSEAARDELLHGYVLRGLDIMCEKFGEGDNPYKYCLDAVRYLLQSIRTHQEGVPADV